MKDARRRASRLVAELHTLYPDAECELVYSNPFELLVATILSAQCTDVRVNAVTRDLFKRYRTPEEFAAAKPAELEKMIRSCGFFRMKAKSIRETAQAIGERFGGNVPADMEGLLSLRGVARKTANVVLGVGFQKAEGVVVDTHVKRLAYRLGLTEETDPEKVERDLMAAVDRADWIQLSHLLIRHGRRVCRALSPACDACALKRLCPQRGVDE